MSVKPIEETETGRVERPATVKVWDPFVRVFHWSLVVLFALAWATEDLQAAMPSSCWWRSASAGASWGRPHARFADFIRSPRATLAYARGLLTGAAPRLLGHNPVAGVMVLALLTMLVATGVSGWLITAEGLGDAEWLQELHEGAGFAHPGTGRRSRSRCAGHERPPRREPGQSDDHRSQATPASLRPRAVRKGSPGQRRWVNRI